MTAIARKSLTRPMQRAVKWREQIVTEDPEHEADLDVGHEDVGRSERRLDDVLDGLVVVGQRHRVHAAGAADVERDGVSGAVEAERGGRQQEQEAHVRPYSVPLM